MEEGRTMDASIAFDADGFVQDTEAWNEDLARRIAAADGLGELDEAQLAVVRHLRDSYRRQGAVPALAHICRLGGFDRDCMNQLFPTPREAWRIAGLPNPGEEAKAYL
jgi:tRNA 2-thiouridine synthesizing protein E